MGTATVRRSGGGICSAEPVAVQRIAAVHSAQENPPVSTDNRTDRKTTPSEWMVLLRLSIKW